MVNSIVEKVADAADGTAAGEPPGGFKETQERELTTFDGDDTPAD